MNTLRNHISHRSTFVLQLLRGLYPLRGLHRLSSAQIRGHRHPNITSSSYTSSQASQQFSKMSTKSPAADLPTISFPTSADFEAYLEREHETAPGVFLKLAKKGSGIASVSSAEAVELALCFGWIDGRANSVDKDWWTVRYTPRRAKSIWSQKNVNTIARLTEEGRMRSAGLATVDAAKADGRWDRAYAGSATIRVPEDLEIALAAEPSADVVWRDMNKTERYGTLMRLQTITSKGRPKLLQTIVQQLAVGRQASSAKLPAKAKSSSGVKKSEISKKKIPSKRAKPTSLTIEGQGKPRREGLRSRS